MEIVYRSDFIPPTAQIIALYNDSGLPRPTTDEDRIKKMYDHANIVVTAWDNEILVGAARAITDWVWCCYLADLAVRQAYQGKGVGKKLIDLTKSKAGEQSMVLLLSVPTAMAYYTKVGLQKVDNAFIIHRSN